MTIERIWVELEEERDLPNEERRFALVGYLNTEYANSAKDDQFGYEFIDLKFDVDGEERHIIVTKFPKTENYRVSESQLNMLKQSRCFQATPNRDSLGSYEDFFEMS